MFMKQIGLILLFTGVGWIAYIFNADSGNSAINRTVWQLFGASGAVVVGLNLIFRRPARPAGTIEESTKERKLKMKIITLIPLFALLAMTGCGNHTTDNQSNPNISPPATPAPAPTSVNPNSTNAAAPPNNGNGEMTTPGSGNNPNAPQDTGNPSITNQPPSR